MSDMREEIVKRHLAWDEEGRAAEIVEALDAYSKHQRKAGLLPAAVGVLLVAAFGSLLVLVIVWAWTSIAGMLG